ncbi:MAG: glycosyltransferase [Gammaproteobacteria bacterium]|nr:glycosyltransferase [Gammaproteobacteria bacterium]
MKFSIIVCTYNRSGPLKRLLDSLDGAIRHAGADGELIIADNNSTDNTRYVIEGFRCEIPVVYVFESRQGKGFALNTALTKARGDLLIFTDDDVTVTSDWISEYLKAAAASRSEWFGGPIYPKWPTSIPAWYRNSDNKKVFFGYLVNYDLSTPSREYQEEDPLPWGASMAIRRRIFPETGGFREDIGVTAKRRGTGMDVNMIARLRAAGARGYYVRDAVCYHHLDKQRLRYRAFVKYGFSRGIDHFRTDQTRPRGSLTRAGMHVLKGLHQLLKGRGDNLRINLIHAGNEIGRLYGERLARRQAKALDS